VYWPVKGNVGPQAPPPGMSVTDSTVAVPEKGPGRPEAELLEEVVVVVGEEVVVEGLEAATEEEEAGMMAATTGAREEVAMSVDEEEVGVAVVVGTTTTVEEGATAAATTEDEAATLLLFVLTLHDLFLIGTAEVKEMEDRSKVERITVGKCILDAGGFVLVMGSAWYTVEVCEYEC
jgi:hypothetical protein